MNPAFVFIHINKTAGSSIEKALGARFEHKTALEKIEELGRERWDNTFTFTFIRNPWDKVVSHYHYRVQTNQTNLKTHRLEFAEWVRLCYGEQDPDYYDQPKMFMPQTDWLTDQQGNILVNFIGRFENLEDDFRQICERLNRSAALPRLKSSQRGDYRDYYNSETIEIVARWFIKDIERFDYKF